MPRLLTARAPANEREQAEVRRLATARHAPADLIVRARIIAASWDGARPGEISELLGCHYETVRKWINRFNAEGIDGLDDAKGRGRKPRIGQDERSRIIALVNADPPGRADHSSWGEFSAADETLPGVWTLDTLTRMARRSGIDIHRSQVRRILRAEGVRWRRPRSWASSRDRDFAPKEPGSSVCTPTRRPARP